MAVVTRFDRVRGFLMSDVFARVAVLVLSVLLAAALGQWRRAQDRADLLARQRDVAVWRLERVARGCRVSTVDGHAECAAGVVVLRTTTTTVVAK